MLSTSPTHPQPRTAAVRYGFTEFDTWHEVLPGVPLRCFVAWGSLDAPDVMPAGSTRAIKQVPAGCSSAEFRPGQ